MPLTQAQVDRLLTPVRPDRIEKVRGNSYVPQFEARAELTRIFGPGNWDSTIHSMTLVYEEPDDRTPDGAAKQVLYWKVCYKCACTLRIRDYWGQQICEYTEWHAEESAPQPNRGEAHALAMTSVESYALRRACINLGDAFGLHLYKDGQLSPLIRGSLVFTDPESPLHREQPKQPDQTALTEEQRTTLANSLGAVEVQPEQPAKPTPEQIRHQLTHPRAAADAAPPRENAQS